MKKRTREERELERREIFFKNSHCLLGDYSRRKANILTVIKTAEILICLEYLPSMMPVINTPVGFKTLRKQIETFIFTLIQRWVI